MLKAPSNAWNVAEPEIMELPAYVDGDIGADIEQDVRLCIQSGARDLVLDCSALDRLTAAGLRSIMTIARDIQKAEGQLMVCNIDGQPQEMFEICGLDTFIPTYGYQGDASMRFVA